MRKRIMVLTAILVVLAVVLCGCEKGSNDTTPFPNTSPNTKDFVFKSGSTTIAMNVEAAPILKSLGEYKSSYEAPSCAFDGMDKIYTYNGFELLTYTVKDVDYVSGVVIRDDTVETPEGITIGSKPEDVKKAYGEFEKDATSANYYTDNCRLLIIFTDGVVSSVQYIAIEQK